MSTFCTSCGTASTGATFCTSCGAAIGTTVSGSANTDKTVHASEPVIAQTPIKIEGEVVSDGSDSSSKKKPLLVGAAAVLILGIGVGSFFAGKSSVDLEKERKAAYDSGYAIGDSAGFDRGDSAGFDRGDSSGYSRGYAAGITDGCENVFEKAGYADHLIEFFPNNYYYRYGSTYVSKTGC